MWVNEILDAFSFLHITALFLSEDILGTPIGVSLITGCPLKTGSDTLHHNPQLLIINPFEIVTFTESSRFIALIHNLTCNLSLCALFFYLRRLKQENNIMPDRRILSIKCPIIVFNCNKSIKYGAQTFVKLGSSRRYSVKSKTVHTTMSSQSMHHFIFRLNIPLSLKTTSMDNFKESETALRSKKTLKCSLNAGFVQQNGFQLSVSA